MHTAKQTKTSKFFLHILLIKIGFLEMPISAHAKERVVQALYVIHELPRWHIGLFRVTFKLVAVIINFLLHAAAAA